MPTSTNPRRTIAALLAAATLVATPIATPLVGSLATAAPTSTAPTTTAPSTTAATARSLHLSGAPNARDFVGYRGAAGAQVNSLVIRSDNLSALTARDVSRLTARSVRSVVDLRTDLERAVQPDKRVPGTKPVTFDVLGRAPITTLIDLPAAYRAFVTDAGARAATRATLLDIRGTAAAGGTTLIHCTAGKDRTGWVSAVLLTILGVDRATVESDFLASNIYRHTTPADRFNGVNIDWLRSSFATANSRYGSFDGYVRTGLGLSDADITSLRTLLLTPARS